MEEPIRYESTQLPLDDEERELMDPDAWDWEHPITGAIVGEPGTILSLEFSRDEHRLLSDAARAEGLTTHQFVKRVAVAAAAAKAAHSAARR